MVSPESSCLCRLNSIGPVCPWCGRGRGARRRPIPISCSTRNIGLSAEASSKSPCTCALIAQGPTLEFASLIGRRAAGVSQLVVTTRCATRFSAAWSDRTIQPAFRHLRCRLHDTIPISSTNTFRFCTVARSMRARTNTTTSPPPRTSTAPCTSTVCAPSAAPARRESMACL